MLNLAESVQRRTTADVVFDYLHEEIASLRLLPGTKLSESEVAKRFNVSRQPVRDAFNRLENLDLLLIRPQRATEVRRFSLKRISHTRFIRLAVELEVIRNACLIWDEKCIELLEDNLQQQHQSVIDGQQDQFHRLDYLFHKLICELGDCPMAFDTIEGCKKKVTRLCVLSLDRKNEFADLLDDHRQIADALKFKSVEKATAATRHHLARLDDTIRDIYAKHSEYFE